MQRKELEEAGFCRSRPPTPSAAPDHPRPPFIIFLLWKEEAAKFAYMAHAKSKSAKA